MTDLYTYINLEKKTLEAFRKAWALAHETQQLRASLPIDPYRLLPRMGDYNIAHNSIAYQREAALRIKSRDSDK